MAATVGTAALGGALAGCGGSGSGSGGAKSVSHGPGPGGYRIDLGGYQGPELTSKQITLKFMRQSWTPPIEALFKQMYQKFNQAYPNITISEEIVPYNSLTSKYQIYVASGGAPDIMMGRMDFAAAYAAGQTTLDLSQYFTQQFISDLHAPLREQASVGTGLYCMPWEDNVRMVVFNRDLFARAHVPTPPEPTDLSGGWTVAQYLEAMQALTRNLNTGSSGLWAMEASNDGAGGPGSNYSQCESTWIRMLGDPNASTTGDEYKTFAGVSSDGLQVSGYLNTPQAIEGMKNYQSLFAMGATPKTAIAQQFNAGVAALSLSSINQANIYEQPGQAPKFNWGVTLVPRGSMLFGCNSSDSPIVYAKTPNPNEATALVGYLCNTANKVAFHRLWGSMPPRSSVVAAMPEYQHPAQQLAVKMAVASYGAPRSKGWFDYFNAINPAVANIALGANVESTLNDAASQIDKLLKKYT